MAGPFCYIRLQLLQLKWFSTSSARSCMFACTLGMSSCWSDRLHFPSFLRTFLDSTLIFAGISRDLRPAKRAKMLPASEMSRYCDLHSSTSTESSYLLTRCFLKISGYQWPFELKRRFREGRRGWKEKGAEERDPQKNRDWVCKINFYFKHLISFVSTQLISSSDECRRRGGTASPIIKWTDWSSTNPALRPPCPTSPP